MADVKKIEWQGGIYPITDEVARGEAQQARTLANTAQSTAERALTAAGNAQNAAGAAQDTADDAQITADTAKDLAENAQSDISDLTAKIATETLQYTPLTPFAPYENGCFVKRSGNTVFLSCALLSTTIQPPAVITNLPAKFRPSASVYIPSMNNTYQTIGYVVLYPNGDLRTEFPLSSDLYLSACFVV